MLQSKLFTRTQKQKPQGEESKNAILLQRAGFVAKEMAGVYSFLPLGFLVLKKIENIIREEMLKLGAFEILMPALTAEASWQKTNRQDLDILFHLEGKDNSRFVLNPTHEEVITPLMRQFVSSYRDLPFSAFQFQNKFRNEPRAKSGVLRAKEFIMKDLYSFHENKECLENFYEKVKEAYFNIFKRVGIKEQTFLTFASGGAFSQYSHEFQTVCPAGEDTIYLCAKCQVAVNKEIVEPSAQSASGIVAGKPTCPKCAGRSLTLHKAVEAGNIFKLSTKFSQAFGLRFKDKQGVDKLVEMGCYGIGLGRLMGIVVEIFNDEKGIIWPKEVAPFPAHLLAIGESPKAKQEAQKIYEHLFKAGIEVLFDDRDIAAGEKFADVDLIGIPLRFVVSEKTITQKSVEIKKRDNNESKLVKTKNMLDVICKM